MTDGLHNLDQWESAFERRSIGRTRIAKSALLFFAGQAGVWSCAVRDMTNIGAGSRIQDLPAVPPNFELSFDRRCRLIWRDGDFIGVAFEDADPLKIRTTSAAR